VTTSATPIYGEETTEIRTDTSVSSSVDTTLTPVSGAIDDDIAIVKDEVSMTPAAAGAGAAAGDGYVTDSSVAVENSSASSASPAERQLIDVEMLPTSTTLEHQQETHNVEDWTTVATAPSTVDALYVEPVSSTIVRRPTDDRSSEFGSSSASWLMSSSSITSGKRKNRCL
jgi:hypothetical protein